MYFIHFSAYVVPKPVYFCSSRHLCTCNFFLNWFLAEFLIKGLIWCFTLQVTGWDVFIVNNLYIFVISLFRIFYISLFRYWHEKCPFSVHNMKFFGNSGFPFPPEQWMTICVQPTWESWLWTWNSTCFGITRADSRGATTSSTSCEFSHSHLCRFKSHLLHFANRSLELKWSIWWLRVLIGTVMAHVAVKRVPCDIWSWNFRGLGWFWEC